MVFERTLLSFWSLETLFTIPQANVNLIFEKKEKSRCTSIETLYESEGSLGLPSKYWQ